MQSNAGGAGTTVVSQGFKAPRCTSKFKFKPGPQIRSMSTALILPARMNPLHHHHHHPAPPPSPGAHLMSSQSLSVIAGRLALLPRMFRCRLRARAKNPAWPSSGAGCDSCSARPNMHGNLLTADARIAVRHPPRLHGPAVYHACDDVGGTLLQHQTAHDAPID